MTGGIHHPHYRVIPAARVRGFWTGICKACPPHKIYVTTKHGPSTMAEQAVLDHLKDEHDIEAKEATT